MIPRRLFWLVDFVIMWIASAGAYAFVACLQPSLIRGGALWRPWMEILTPAISMGVPLSPVTDFLWMFLALSPATILFLEIFKAYDALIEQPCRRIIVAASIAPFCGLAMVALALFATKSLGWSRLWVFSFSLFSAAGLCSVRLTLRSYFMRRRALGYYTKEVLLVGSPLGLEWLARFFMETTLKSEYRVCGFLTLESGNALGGLEHTDIPHLGTVSGLSSLLVHKAVHEVIVAYPNSGEAWLKQVIKDCDYFQVLLRIVPEILLDERPRDLRILYHAEALHLPAIVLKPPHWNSNALFAKRMIDIILSFILLIILLPVFALVAVAIKVTTPNLPVFYRWKVVGHKGVHFTGFKFTTMDADADTRREQLLSKNEMSGPVFKIKNDPRVTPLGKFLRKYSINELPQLWSVLTGDMSLVGPRPAFPHELRRYEIWHKRKLIIRPGLTCLWQVRGRNKITDFNDWVRMDLEYIDNWSLWLDVKILLRTAWVVIRGTGS